MAKQKKFVQNNNNLAIAYYRYSSHAQNETSIDQQREEAERYAEAHGSRRREAGGSRSIAALSALRGHKP